MPEEGGLQQLDHPDKRFVTQRAVPGAHAPQASGDESPSQPGR